MALAETRLPPQPCPNCRTQLDCAGNLDGERPKPGDVTVCVECAAPLRYSDNMTVRELTDLDFRDVPLLVLRQLDALQAMVRKYIDRRKPEKE